MRILITPHDIIERALWDDYEYYILSRDKNNDVEKIIEENIEFEIDEKDALVIGLLKCIETDNLIHRCNQYIEHLMNIRSVKHDNAYFLRKNLVISEIEKFRKKFPPSWKPQIHYKNALENLNKYIDELLNNIEDIKIVTMTDKYGEHELIKTIHLKKALNYHA